MNFKRFLTGSAATVLWAAAMAQAATPVGSTIAYQGRLDVSGFAAEGTYDFRFRLYDADSAGAQIGAAQFLADAALTDGTFTAPLDFGASAFTSDARWVEISVRDGASSGAYTVLAPRQRVYAAPVALKAINENWSASGNNIFNANSGNVGVNEPGPLARLHVTGANQLPNLASSMLGTDQILVEAQTAWIGLYSDEIGAPASGISFSEVNSTNGALSKWAIAQRTSGNGADLSITYGNNQDGNANARYLQVKSTGDVGIGVNSPNAKLHVKTLGTTPFTPENTLRITSEYPSTIANTTEYMDFKGNQIHAKQDNNPSTLELQPDNGEVAIGPGLLSDAKLTITRTAVPNLFNSDLSLDDVVIQDAANAWLGLYSDPSGNVGSGITFGESSGSAAEPKWAIYARTSDNVGDLNITFGTGTNPTNNEKMLQIDRDGTTKVKVLEILGADVSERFPMKGCVEPGMVVMIDAGSSGHLCLAAGEYNTRVAGIVSGAGDIPVGAILGNMKGSEDAPPIALSGRVWTYCDATEAAIEVGDLLTTSATPGHAMKASDAGRRGGAVIGKAMSSLALGETGLVLVLVNLQ